MMKSLLIMIFLMGAVNTASARQNAPVPSTLEKDLTDLCAARLHRQNVARARISDICKCEWKNLNSHLDKPRLMVVLKEAQGKNVRRDLRNFEDGQVIFDYVLDVRAECRVNPFWVMPPEDPGLPDRIPNLDSSGKPTKTLKTKAAPVPEDEEAPVAPAETPVEAPAKTPDPSPVKKPE